MRSITRGLPAAAAALLGVVGMVGVAGPGVAAAAPRAAVKHLKPIRAGAGSAVAHGVDFRQLARTVHHSAVTRAGRALAPAADVITPTGADVTSSFDGTSGVASGRAQDNGPDPSSATNGSQIVEVTDNFFHVFDNNGVGQCGSGMGMPLTTFLHTSDQLNSEPAQIEFDNFQGHFIATVPVANSGNSQAPALYVIISNTSNPCGNWHFYRLTFSGGPYGAGNSLGSIILGQDRRAALFETDVFSHRGVFQAHSIFAISKADLFAGNNVNFPTFTVGTRAAPTSNAGEPMIDSSSAYFLGAEPQIGYQLYRMSGTGTSSPSVTLQATIASTYSPPLMPRQPSGDAGPVSDDGRFTSAQAFDGTRIWFAHGIDVGSDPATIRYGYVDVTTNKETDALIGVDPSFSDELNGSVGVGLNANGTEAIFLNWAYTDANKGVNISDAVESFVFNGSLPTTVGNLQTLATGTESNTIFFGVNSSVAVEPSQFGNTTCAVTTQEYYLGTWTTRLARVCSPNQIDVPSVKADTPAQAASVLASFGLSAGAQTTTPNCDGVPDGTVVSTTPASGQPVPFGTSIGLTLCKPPTTKVPPVIGDTVDDATAAIQSAGLVVGTISLTTSCDVPAGTIASSSPRVGDVVSPGTTVNMAESTGLPPTPCP